MAVADRTEHEHLSGARIHSKRSWRSSSSKKFTRQSKMARRVARRWLVGLASMQSSSSYAFRFFARERMPRYTDLLPTLDLEILKCHHLCGTCATVLLVLVQNDRQGAIWGPCGAPFSKPALPLLFAKPHTRACIEARPVCHRLASVVAKTAHKSADCVASTVRTCAWMIDRSSASRGTPKTW